VFEWDDYWPVDYIDTETMVAELDECLATLAAARARALYLRRRLRALGVPVSKQRVLDDH
jgi:hypothetical protein